MSRAAFRGLLPILGLVLALGACTRSHGWSDDGSAAEPRSADGAVILAMDDGGVDDGSVLTPEAPSAEGATCGPNRCRGGEVCCDEICGVCGFEGECPSGFECPVPADR